MLTLSSVYQQYFPLLNTYVQKRVGDKFVAHDIVTDVILKVVKRYPDMSDYHLKGALLISTRNKCWDWENRQKRLKKDREQYEYLSASDLEDFSRAEIKADLLEYMESSIEELPPVCKQVFRFKLQGLRDGDISLQMKIAQKTVRNQLSLARGILRTKIRSLY